MSRLIKASIDVTKIKKEHIFEGKKGKYINIDIWINDEVDEYGNIAGIKQSYKEGNDFNSHYIGNGKDPKAPPPQAQAQEVVESVPATPIQDDLPF
jgi:hypothetical protein